MKWFKKKQNGTVNFIQPIKRNELSDDEKINAFINDFNENIRLGRFYLSSNFSKAANNINEILFGRLQEIASRSGYVLTKHFGEYETVTIYEIDLR